MGSSFFPPHNRNLPLVGLCVSNPAIQVFFMALFVFVACLQDSRSSALLLNPALTTGVWPSVFPSIEPHVRQRRLQRHHTTTLFRSISGLQID
jgi:threonine/homoserine/homoserine lactone efflux protein